MKTIGLLGGMSWESTLTYYQIINMVTAQTLGGLHSARCLGRYRCTQPQRLALGTNLRAQGLKLGGALLGGKGCG